jgi:hypothetical protein
VTKTKTMIVHGQEVEVTICPPSRRRATPRKRRRYAGNGGAAKGANWVAKERGLAGVTATKGVAR